MQLVDVARQAEAKPVRKVLLEHFDRLKVELNDFAANRADQVIVVLAFERPLVPRAFTARNQRDLKQTSFNQEWQNSVHRGRVCIRIPSRP